MIDRGFLAFCGCLLVVFIVSIPHLKGEQNERSVSEYARFNKYEIDNRRHDSPKGQRWLKDGRIIKCDPDCDIYKVQIKP